jgi:lipopolysaccharide export system protein LptA
MIDLRSADVLNRREINGEEVRELIGNVHFIQTTASGERVRVWCDRAIRFMAQNKVDLFGNVKIVRDSVTITAPEGTYFADERRAEMRRNIRLQKGKTALSSRYGEHFVDEKRSLFRDDVRLQDSLSTVTCNALEYIESEQKSIATGNVVVVNTQNAITIFGDSLVHFDRREYTIVPKNPRMIQIDTSSAGVVDTFMVVSKVMHAYRDSTQRFIAEDSVSMARNDLSARCGRATYYAQRDLIILQEQPVVWQSQNQVTGDSIVIRLQDRRLSSVYVKGKAMAISRADSLRRNRFDQLTGKELTMYFSQNKLAHVDVVRNATSLYYLYEGAQPNGVNKSSGDRILIEFQDGTVDRIKIIGGVQGQYFPEKMIARRERDYNLDGFRWFDVRPRRRQLSIVNERYD